MHPVPVSPQAFLLPTEIAKQRIRETLRGKPSSAHPASQVAHILWATQYYDDVEYLKSLPDLGVEDITAALTLIPSLRDLAEDDERHLIRAARSHGVEWQDIGLMLGYPERSARQSAAARARRLGIPVERTQQRRRPAGPGAQA